MVAEGGTEYAHRETMQRSKCIWGPYEACPHNPIISHKEYKKSEIQATGHADLVDDANGNWWLVFLGIRRFSHALLHNLGRETFLAPVSWDDEGWPVVGYNGNGTIELETDAPLPDAVHPVDHSVTIDFHKGTLDNRLFYTRNPIMENYIHTPLSGTLKLIGTDITINEPGASPTIMSFKQPQFTTTVTAKLILPETNARRCGIAAYYNNDYHYEIYVGNDSDGQYVGFYKHIHDMGVELVRIPISSENNDSVVIFRIDTDREKYTFSYALTKDVSTPRNEPAYITVGSGLNAGLSTEGTKTMTFTGTLFSLFSEKGTGTFADKVELTINPDVDYKL